MKHPGSEWPSPAGVLGARDAKGCSSVSYVSAPWLPRQLSKAERNTQIVEMYLAGEKYEVIARANHLTTGAINKILYKRGVVCTRQPAQIAIAKERNPRLPALRAAGKSYSQIGRELGMSAQHAWLTAKKMGVR